MKICGLVPCLMRDNSRKNNIKAIRYAAENYGLEEIVVYDQCFSEDDVKNMPQNVRLIGNEREPKGFVVPRNSLFAWFYDSDYDYALLFDAHDSASRPCLNDLQTVIEALKSGKLEVNMALSTMGIHASQERIQAKQRKDFQTDVWLLRSKKGYEWLHGAILCNMRKRYGIRPLINEKCDNWSMTPEDIFFVMLMRRILSNQVQLMPTVTFSEPSFKDSSWMSKEGSFAYPEISYGELNKLVDESMVSLPEIDARRVPNAVSVPRLRNEALKDIKPYRPRKMHAGRNKRL